MNLVPTNLKSKPIIETAALVLIAIIVAILVRIFLLQLFYIPSGSMEPNLKIDDNVFVNKLAYEFNDIERGDIVVLKAPKEVTERDEKIKDLIKRVIGLPGDTVEGKCNDGETQCKVKVYVNGKLLKEPYINKDDYYSVYAPFDPISVPANSVLLLGDNRAHSSDGRVFGTVKEDEIIGRAFLRVWPLDRAGLL